jgi:YD repeat-containing protein
MGTQTITMAQNVYIGLAVSSMNTGGSLATATFDNVSINSFSGTSGGLWGFISNAAGGAAISGAQVQASQWNTVKGTAWSDVNGRFALGNLPEGAYDLTASSPSFGTSTTPGIVVVPYLDTTVNIILSAPGSISGKVTKADGVTAISGAAVQAMVGGTLVASAVTDSSGNFTLGGLSTGNYQVQASADGYVPASQAVSVSAGSATTFNFALQGPGSSNGAVSYFYDALGRLVGVINAAGDAATYNYDPVGNILSISRYSSSQLSVVSFSPATATVGAAITIFGTGFSTTAGQNAVLFNGVAGVVQSASATQLIVTVPAGASSGPITVTTSAGTVTSNSSFTVSTP